MTKLKGTILLGEGYNRTKAIFDGNIDNLEVESISIKDSTARDVLLGNGTTLPLFNESNTINSQYLPSYVDDVIEAPSRNDFPIIGESGKIYLDISTNSTYRWSGSTYVLITSGDGEAAINDLVELISQVESNTAANTEKIDTIEDEITDILNTLIADKFKEYDKEYLTFTALEDSTVGYEMPMWASDDELPVLDLLYSYDGITWTNFDGTTLSITAGNFVKFKGDNTEFHRNIGAFIINGKVDVSGNVMSIVYADNFIGKIDFPNDEFNLSNLFGYQCLGLYSAHNLILPTLNLTYLCYYDMFAECISLISTPELPATTLLEECYCGMFSGCTSLTIAPLLPSLELAPLCYCGMFYNCSSLVIAPELPATMLATSCYSGMFNKCSSLVNAPILPAIVLAYECYLEMFYDCVSLISTPELPATILADGCYNMMFYGCTSLTNICELPAKKLKNSCYLGMFGMCTSLIEIPELHAKTLVYNCYTGMFSGCDNVTYATLLCDMPETSDQYSACEGMFSAPSGTIVLSSTALSYPTIVPQGWKVVNYYVNNDYITKLNNRINSSNKNIQSNTTEIDILKNRIISTTYSELKDAVTNSTLTTGQYYRIIDYVTTCNGTSAKVEDASTIDPENPVDGQSRSAGHLFDIVIRALSPNQLDENAIAVCNESETYYDSTFNGTVVKYSIENKYWSTEDGKGTIYYMKDHNDNECSYDFTNIEYYYAEDTTWYLTFNVLFNKDVRSNVINTNINKLPFILFLLNGGLSGGDITGNTIIGDNCLGIIFKGPSLKYNSLEGTHNNVNIITDSLDNILYNNIFIGSCYNINLKGTTQIANNLYKGYCENISVNATQINHNIFMSNCKDITLTSTNSYITHNVFDYINTVTINTTNYITNNNLKEISNLTVTANYFYENVLNTVENLTSTVTGSFLRNEFISIYDTNITASVVKGNNLKEVYTLTVNANNKFEFNNFLYTSTIIFNCGGSYINIGVGSQQLTFNSTNSSYDPKYFDIGKGVSYCTFTGKILQTHITDGTRYLNISVTDGESSMNTYIHNVRGESSSNRLTILLVNGNHKKDIYKDVSGRIFHVWEDNLVKKGYYINDNTDTEWKEIPTPEEPVEVPTIPDAVTTALSVATLDLTTRTTIATIAVDETLAFTLVPAIQGEYRLVIINSSEADITVTMPTEENYQCLCGATLTIPAQTNIELIINVTDTLIYIRKG